MDRRKLVEVYMSLDLNRARYIWIFFVMCTDDCSRIFLVHHATNFTEYEAVRSTKQAFTSQILRRLDPYPLQPVVEHVVMTHCIKGSDLAQERGAEGSTPWWIGSSEKSHGTGCFAPNIIGKGQGTNA